MTPKPLKYMSFLLRLWEEKCDGKSVWRASLEGPGSDKPLAFSSFDALISHLQTKMVAKAASQPEKVRSD